MTSETEKNARPLRVMWLLNHKTARCFEIEMLNRIGISEIFLPKSFPSIPVFRSASVDYSQDAHLSIPDAELAILNNTHWYERPSKQAWEIANRYFDVLFFILYDVEYFYSIIKNFKGAILLRAYGLEKSSGCYANVLKIISQNKGDFLLKKLGQRFWFAHAYAHQGALERDVLAERALYLPLGMIAKASPPAWTGDDKRIFFVCPDIGLTPYYKEIYLKFSQDFKDFPYVIAGTQPIKVQDPKLLGYVSHEAHQHNLCSMRLMFYHSQEPNHIHYHPFEAVHADMPLIFMAGGLLDKLGGTQLPGRCKNIAEARQKIRRILNDDWPFIKQIQSTQKALLKPMQADNCIETWKSGFKTIQAQLANVQNQPLAQKKKRIAIFVPLSYRGGSLRGSKLLAEAIRLGSEQAEAQVELVFAYLYEDKTILQDSEELQNLSPAIKRRSFSWQVISQEQAKLALRYAHMQQDLKEPWYQIPDDGISHFMDCDLWIIISDRLEHPLLPLRPYILMVYDYLQRYEPIMDQNANQKFILAALMADSVWVTTHFTRQDALHYAGLAAHKVQKLPMLAPAFPALHEKPKPQGKLYFIWTTNLAIHKNHCNALKALQIYYEELNGQFECRISGVNTENLLKGHLPHLQAFKGLLESSKILRKQVKIIGELSDHSYQSTLAKAQFLWHAGRIDNGSFSVVEAAYLGVPALSSDYPAMREMDAQFELNLAWMDPLKPRAMALQLKKMEEKTLSRAFNLPSFEALSRQSLEKLAIHYWKALEEQL